MAEPAVFEKALVDAHVDAEVFVLRPDYRAMLLAVDGLVPAQPIRKAMRCCRQPKTQRARRFASCQWSKSRTSRHGGRRTAHSGPSRNAPATVWRRCCAVPRQAYRA